ncbi:hypothetical protein CLV62_101509 [Dysgonomonas alginatilytica]|uniref:Uncharacterized protein n=1 Tax=Dysgonomonas alginatilytica TaxID=1605892 RepID=A0A2V3PU51_9BACT|nr:hypothetical protein [Dysgonomonas alginatilytica]PXV69240.1 hypothetical protein CLV62_101509 [Dysgonomonas alginatilytica]
MENNFNEQDSLRLINEMIAQARNNFRKGAGNSSILWGYTIAILAMFNFIFSYILEFRHYASWVWILTIPIFIGNYWYGYRKAKKAEVITHLDRVVDTVWLGFFISNTFFVSSTFFIAITQKTYVPYLFITPIIMIMVGLALFVTAKACRFKPYLYGAYIFWLGAVLCILQYALVKSVDLGLVILSVSMILGFVIPGHILNRKAESNV